jgi:hypothetical protein
MSIQRPGPVLLPAMKVATGKVATLILLLGQHVHIPRAAQQPTLMRD